VLADCECIRGGVFPHVGHAQVAPQPGDPSRTVPEKVEPRTPPKDEKGLPVPEAPPGSLSDKLERNRGVLKPPAGIDPGIKKPAPEPDPGNMPVIPPPGSPGNPSPAIPK